MLLIAFVCFCSHLSAFWASFQSEPFAIGPVQFSRPRGVAENWFTKPGFARKTSKTQSSLNFLQSGPRRFTKSDFSGLAPIWRVLYFRQPEVRQVVGVGVSETLPSLKSVLSLVGLFGVCKLRRQ